MPSTRTTGGVPALRWRSLARAAIIFSSTARMFMRSLFARRPARAGPPPMPAAARSERLDQEQLLSVLHGLGVLDQDADDAALGLGFDLVHQLHRFDDADRLPHLDHVAD